MHLLKWGIGTFLCIFDEIYFLYLFWKCTGVCMAATSMPFVQLPLVQIFYWHFRAKNGTIRLESSSQFLGLIESYLSFKKEEIAPGMAAEGEQVLFRDFWVETFLKRLLQEFMQVSTWHWKELLLSRIKYTYYYHVRVWHMGVYTHASQK